MKQLDKIIGSLTGEFQKLNTFENDELLEVTFQMGDAVNLTDEKLLTAYRQISSRDQMILEFIVGSNDPISSYTPQDDFPAISARITGEVNDDPAEAVHVHLTVYKKREGQIISLYDLGLFSSFVSAQPLTVQLTLFAKFLQPDQAVIFDLFEDQDDLKTDAVLFLKTDSISSVPPADYPAYKKSRLNQIRTVAFYGGLAQYQFIPEDFFLHSASKELALNELFNRLTVYVLVTSLFDISEPVENGIFYKLNGFKSFSGTAPFTSLPVGNLQDYFEVYAWIYESGNIADKIGLTRNILSLHFVSETGLAINGRPLLSIRSAFDLYLKQNIKQYIEIRNKISEQLVDFNKRATLIIDTFGGSFQKSALATVTFFSTVILTKVFTQKDVSNIFNHESYILTWLFIITSSIYYEVSRREVLSQRQRFVQAYQNMKNRYSNLLISEDIDRILAKDKDYTDDLAYIDEKTRLYRNMWIIVLALIAALSTLLYLLFLFNNPVVMILIFLVLVLVLIAVRPFRE